MFLCSIIFYLFLYLKCTSYIAGFCFLNQSDNLCLLINMFRSFTSYIIQILWDFQHSWVYLYFLATWFLFIPCRVFLIASFSFFLAFFWVNWIFFKRFYFISTIRFINVFYFIINCVGRWYLKFLIFKKFEMRKSLHYQCIYDLIISFLCID